MNIKDLKFSDTLIFMLSFILFTVIGAVSHEYGHILVAKYYGYSTTLSYGSMNYNIDQKYDILDSISEINKYAIQNNKDFSQRKIYKDLQQKLADAPLFISIGGPAQTILVGTIGFIFLIFRRKNQQIHGFKFIDWVAVLCSLF
jgi:hypothetical protein